MTAANASSTLQPTKFHIWIDLLGLMANTLKSIALTVFWIVIIWNIIFSFGKVASAASQTLDALKKNGVQNLEVAPSGFKISLGTASSNSEKAVIKSSEALAVASAIKSEDPKTKEAIDNLTKQLQELQSQTLANDQKLKSIGIEAGIGVKQGDGTSQQKGNVVTTGWIYLGRASSSGVEWAPGNDRTVSTAQVPKVNDEAKIVDAVNLRREPKAGTPLAEAPFLGIVAAGTRVKILQLNYTPAKIGGRFIRAEVELL
jgi:hypothetical protein